MAESRAVAGFDRLPWLADDHVQPRRPRLRSYLPWLVLLIAAVAAAAFWIGSRSRDSAGWVRFDGSPATRSTLALPDARDAAPATPEAQALPVDKPLPLPTIPAIAEPRAPEIGPPSPPARRVRTTPSRKPATANSATPAPAKSAETEKKTSVLDPWPVRSVDGSSGRLVRVGTFATRHQAKLGWRALMRVNPSLQRLPALVVPATSSRDGRTYYRLQMGTTSQAHSAVLCQRMRMIGLSCIIVDAPAKADGDK